MPTKKPRGQELTREQELANQALHYRRLRIEHVNSSVKRCRIVKDRLRLWKEGVRDLVMELCCALHPTFKGAECPYRFFVLRAPHTMSGRGPARHSTAGDGAVHHRPAHPLDHLFGIGPVPLVQIRPTRPPPWGSLLCLCFPAPAGHEWGERGAPAAG